MHNIAYVLRQVVCRDLKIYRQRKSDYLLSILLYVIILSLLPLVAGTIASQELWIIPCLVWIAAMLSNALSQEYLLRHDFELGVYEQFLISKQPLSLILTTKVLLYWVTISVPTILVTPIICYTLNLPAPAIQILLLSLLLGTPTLCFLGGIVAALTLTLRNSGILLTLLLLPLYIPVLILGASSVILTIQGMPCGAQLALLGAIGIIVLMVAPFAMSIAIKANVA